MLTVFQQSVLRILAANRTPASHIAGGAALNRGLPRLTGDIDIFHDVAASVQSSAASDIQTLVAADYGVEEDPALRHLTTPLFVERIVTRGDHLTRLQWAADSAVRFLPPVQDPLFGFRLSDPDLAVNKILALAGWSAARDVVDTVALHDGGFPLLALVWAAPGKDPGFSPSLLLEWMTRNAHSVTLADWRSVASDAPVDIVGVKRALLEAVDEARVALGGLPSGPTGQLFLTEKGVALRPTSDFLCGKLPATVTALSTTIGPATVQVA